MGTYVPHFFWILVFSFFHVGLIFHMPLWGVFGSYGDLRGPMGTYGDFWSPMGTYGDLWGPMGTFGDLWGVLGSYGDLQGPMFPTFSRFWLFGFFLLFLVGLIFHMPQFPNPFCFFLSFWGGGHQILAHPFWHPPTPLPPSIRPILYTLQTQHATSDIRH